MPTITLRVPKDIDAATERKIRKLKGSLIAKSLTDIIHFDDDGEAFYIHYFTTLPEKKQEALNYISLFIAEDALTDVVVIL